MRYFLDIRTGDQVIPDREGEDFIDILLACEHALDVANELEREFSSVADGAVAVLPTAVELVNERRALLLSVPVHNRKSQD
jgi:hypothetical protein